ncbi:calcium-dependent lipid-binding protein-like [Carya illinoinensis]|uniref:calcium-dependent lipid-binding protein-like n=1 Tax=Carya illinoinensis TaxID=32201 RepID=UPI001C71C6A5|nr:calcium-dependent lipid-binding protein-like [Carya illinoinensis]XP_042978222.1 calcium-dependent lipid-binding protein-like [Carya illinoinensis]
MGLISGVFMGMVFGIALMAGWKQMMRYRSTKRIAKAVDIKLLGSLNRDDLKKICGDNFPEWISFPAFEQRGLKRSYGLLCFSTYLSRIK